MSDSSLGRLKVYLNDHRAGAVAGRALADRSARLNRGSALGDYLVQSFLQELERERVTLDEMFRVLRLHPNRMKRVFAVGFEFITRLKRRRWPRHASPLSRMIEVEALMSGVASKRQMWSALVNLDVARRAVGAARLERHLQDAERQLAQLDGHHRSAATDAFGTAEPKPRS